MLPLPVRAVSADPSNLGTKDCHLICYCDDGCDYAVKTLADGKYIPHSEWFCKHLGDQIGIASPDCRMVEVNGQIAFGSRWESGHEPKDWVYRLKDGRIERDRVIPTISRIFAFDLFVNNEDRHTNNYIVRQQIGGWSFLAFDHSISWMATKWPLPNAPMEKTLNTTRNFKIIDGIVGGILDADEFNRMIGRLKSVPVARIGEILHAQHESWLSQAEKDAILSYWGSSDFLGRLDKIEEGLTLGNYV